MSETIGQQLSQARQERKISLYQAAQSTHIRQHYLEAMEADDFARLPSQAQARGLLRAYAGYLGLDARPLLAELDGTPPPPALNSYPEAIPPSQAAGLAHEGSMEIFSEIGQKLRDQRETLGFSLDEVERSTRLRRHYLEALEIGNLEGLPSPVQGRGMLNNYATFLRLDPEPLLLRYAEGLQARLAARQATRPRPHPAAPARRAGPGWLPRVLSSDFLIGGILFLGLAAFIIWSISRINASRGEQKPSVTVPSVAEALLVTPLQTGQPVASASATPEQVATLPIPPPAAEGNTTLAEGTPGAVSTPGGTLPEDTPGGDTNAALQISIAALQRAWMRVVVDGDVEFEGRVIPGSAYQFGAQDRIELLTGNGAALQVFFGETDLGVMGNYGEVVYRVFTEEGVLVPTATITPTPTATLPPTSTPAVTPTELPAPAP